MNFQNQYQQSEQLNKTYLSCHSYNGLSGDIFSRHCHTYFELVFIYSGIRKETIDNFVYDLHEDTLAFIKPLSVHSQENITDVNDLILQFDIKKIQHLSPAFPDNATISITSDVPIVTIDKDTKVHELLYSLKTYIEQRNEKFPLYSDNQEPFDTEKLYFDIKISSTCEAILSELLSMNILKLHVDFMRSSDIKHLEPVINRIITHPEENLKMDEAAKIANMSYSHFSRLFKKTLGESYAIFTNRMRIHFAESLLLNTNKTITEIASHIGIDTLPYFTRLFKNYTGLSPLEYRKKYHF